MSFEIACIYHSVDLDGWMSAAIVKHWFITNNKNCKAFEDSDNKRIVSGSGDILDFIGYNYGQPIPDLSEYHRIIMCDISFSDEGKPAKEMLDLFGMNTKEDKYFIWIDHHNSAMVLYNKPGVDYFIHGLLDAKNAACELAWMYFFPKYDMPEIVRLLGRYDCFGHKGTDEEQMVLEFQYGARTYYTNYEDCYEALAVDLLDKNNKMMEDTEIEHIHNKGIAIYYYLCTEAKQSYKNGFEIELMEPSIGNVQYGATTRKFLAINKERFNPINFGIDYHKDGYDGIASFHYDKSLWKFSLYNDNGLVDCSAIAKSFGGGGHKDASGFILTRLSKIMPNMI
jgi:oligoribonuclease NrnB/cAMP/cGMP phosphodiesterase (DHH superfamily)